MIRKAVWWAAGGFIFCIGAGVSIAWALVITVGTAVIGAL